MAKMDGKLLIHKLYKNPEKFVSDGRGYQLLQAFFDGFSIESLEVLLTEKNIYIQRVAAWIISELGVEACELLDKALPLAKSPDRNIKYHILEFVAVCSVRKNVQSYLEIIKSLEDQDPVIRNLSMRLISNGGTQTYKAVSNLLGNFGNNWNVHKGGMEALLDYEQLAEQDIVCMLNDDNPIVRKYGIMVAKKLYNRNPKLINNCLISKDLDVAHFADEVLEIYSE